MKQALLRLALRSAVLVAVFWVQVLQQLAVPTSAEEGPNAHGLFQDVE